MRSEKPRTTKTWSRTRRAALLAVLAAILAAPAWAQQEADYEKLMADKSPAIVTVKFLLKMKSNWGEHELEQEVPATLIGKDGLVMCANSHFGGGPWMQNAGVTATPADFKILIGTDTEGREATLLARDTDLDLAWLRLKEVGDKPLTTIDLQKAATPTVGERLYGLSRLGKYFDRIPVIGEMRMGGSTEKPRPLYIPSGGNGAVGLPVFNAKGEVVGVSITQMPEGDESDQSSAAQGGVMILPAEKAWKATERALATAGKGEGEGEDEK
jgi:hypothetical protein